MFEGIDFKAFWDDSDYSEENYHSKDYTDELLRDVERELGYHLPKAYAMLMKQHNGGLVKLACCPCARGAGLAEDYISISGIMGIGRDKKYSLCGARGSRFMIEEWGYPAIGVAICDTPSAGHGMVFLDYRDCGATGEPCVVYVDQEQDYKITKLADDFEAFVGRLRAEASETGNAVEGLISGGMKVTDKLLAALAKIKNTDS